MNDPNNILASGPDSHEINLDALWEQIINESHSCCDPLLASFFNTCIHSHPNFATALACMIGRKLGDMSISSSALTQLVQEAYSASPSLISTAAADLIAVMMRDAACSNLVTPFLFFKGFHSIQAHRISHWLWNHKRDFLALHLQSRISEVFGVDVHPAAKFGQRVMIDHATAVVIGETAVIEDDVSILQGVTLGGTGKVEQDRHPKIRRGVLIGAGAKILGNVEVGEGAKVGAGSIVLERVHPYTTVVGNPARQVGVRHRDMPGISMDLSLPPIDYII
ncbi:serine O-acetyltransferase [Commensalibacter oyaizuii]|uniref:Serine acetyltransferase n=1 Tax=Commensalibacter oyaizuii TaxID=3043873 RepID=A0ABT6Q3H6_9PROT|nr:serine O-acetyltransferase [Commensalibacter sp. TBRC 16381]MDI2091652.1 serine O-acetyltransferase [Commensalibacter sp. TBRC 16381]